MAQVKVVEGRRGGCAAIRSGAVMAFVDDGWRRHPLSAHQLRVLDPLVVDQRSAGQVATERGIRPSAASELVSPLRRQGLLTRRHGPVRRPLRSDCGPFAYSRHAATVKPRAMLKDADLVRQEIGVKGLIAAQA